RLDPYSGKRLLELQFLRRVHRTLEPLVERPIPDQLDGRLLHSVFGKAGRAAVLLEQGAHEVVERSGTPAAPAQLEIEQESDDAPFQVVRDGGVRGALVRPIVLDPGVERRLRE